MADPAVLRLGWMLAALGLVLMPMVPRLPVWASLTFVACAIWRLVAAHRGWRLPSRPFRMVLALLVCLGVLWSYRTFNGLEAGSALLVVMAAMKLLETRARRDVQVLAFIGYFLVMSQLLWDQSVWSLPWLVFVVAAITLALLQGVRSGPPLPWRTGTGIVLRMLAFALPVALVLFLLFPRVPGPFWALPSRGSSGMTGLDDQMRPGTVADLIGSEEVAFRVSFDGAVPPPADRYWRGPVMERFDGFTWRDAERWPLAKPRIRPRGRRYAYRMVLEPHGRPWLLAMDYPLVWSDTSALLTQDFQLVTRQPAENVRALRVESWPDAVPEAELGIGARERFTRLPARRNPRSLALAGRLREQTPSDAAYLDAVLRLFREEAFVYTLRPPLLQGAHPVDDFLFRTRRGFCEHFASAFTVLARAGGIPARVVTGYQGGEVNPVSNRLVVRQSDAHAWSEVWLDGRGWTRMDPTAAVAPDRIELGIEEALPAGERLPGLSLRAIPGLEGLRQGWDAVNSVWNEWVLGYGPERQNDFLARLGLPGRDWQSMVLVLTAGVAGIMGLLTVWLAWRGRAPRPEAALRLYRRYCRRLAKDGLARRPSEGPADFARRVGAARPGIAPAVAEFTRLYLGLRYGEADRGELPALRRALRRVRP